MRIISGKAKGKKIQIPIDKKTRPLKDMVRESIFNIIQHSNLLSSGFDELIILDLFSGVGSFGLEAISRGAKKVIFFEDYNPALKMLYQNIDNFVFAYFCHLCDVYLSLTAHHHPLAHAMHRGAAISRRPDMARLAPRSVSLTT